VIQILEEHERSTTRFQFFGAKIVIKKPGINSDDSKQIHEGTFKEKLPKNLTPLSGYCIKIVQIQRDTVGNNDIPASRLFWPIYRRD
jgi:hypothetical protein